MLNIIVFGVTLVLAQVVSGLVMMYVTTKLMTSKWFMQKYAEWMKGFTKNYEKLWSEIQEEEV